MDYKAETPFDSIEGSHEYVAMLAGLWMKPAGCRADCRRRGMTVPIAARRPCFWFSYNLAKLNLHITTSRRILNDLRSGVTPGGAWCARNR